MDVWQAQYIAFDIQSRDFVAARFDYIKRRPAEDEVEAPAAPCNISCFEIPIRIVGFCGCFFIGNVSVTIVNLINPMQEMIWN
jgi:hypothetical protein